MWGQGIDAKTKLVIGLVGQRLLIYFCLLFFGNKVNKNTMIRFYQRKKTLNFDKGCVQKSTFALDDVITSNCQST